MKISKDGTIILVENPLTGNGSFGKTLNLSDGEKWQLPSEARKAVGEDKWKLATKIVLVREPTARFLSGITLLANSTAEQVEAHGGSPDFALSAVEAVSSSDTPKARYLALMALLTQAVTDSGWASIPIYLRPQEDWLSCKFDTVIATPNIAEYFNRRGKGSCIRSNQLNRNPKLLTITCPPEREFEIRKLYAEDFKLFIRLLVWSPEPTRIRLVTGYCSSCEAKRRNKQDAPVAVLDLTALMESAPDRPERAAEGVAPQVEQEQEQEAQPEPAPEAEAATEDKPKRRRKA